MHIKTIVFASLACAFVIAGGAFVARMLFWRPVMPEIVVELRASEGRARPAELLLVYGSAGSDPFRPGTLARDERVSGCDTSGAYCRSGPSRHAFHMDGTRRQSLQIREMTGEGNPIIGGVVWTGRSYPERVTVVCDLGMAEPRKACAVVEVKI